VLTDFSVADLDFFSRQRWDRKNGDAVIDGGGIVGLNLAPANHRASTLVRTHRHCEAEFVFQKRIVGCSAEAI